MRKLVMLRIKTQARKIHSRTKMNKKFVRRLFFPRFNSTKYGCSTFTLLFMSQLCCFLLLQACHTPFKCWFLLHLILNKGSQQVEKIHGRHNMALAPTGHVMTHTTPPLTWKRRSGMEKNGFGYFCFYDKFILSYDKFKCDLMLCSRLRFFVTYNHITYNHQFDHVDHYEPPSILASLKHSFYCYRFYAF